MDAELGYDPEGILRISFPPLLPHEDDSLTRYSTESRDPLPLPTAASRAFLFKGHPFPTAHLKMATLSSPYSSRSIRRGSSMKSQRRVIQY